jgi:uncharacterized protein YndB with AHSA1/START domain
MSETGTVHEDGTFAVTRDVDADPQRAWQAWSDPALVQRWWGPTGYSAPVARMDVRVGGSSLVGMQGPDGATIYTTWTYTQVEPTRVLAFDSSFADEHGHPVPPAHYGIPPVVPERVPHVVTFEPLPGGRTRVTVTESGYQPGPAMEGSRAGQEQVLDKFAEVVARA